MSAPHERPGPLPPLGWRPRRWWVGALIAAVLTVFVYALIRSLETPTWTVHLDVAIRDWTNAHRPKFMEILARGVNYLGQGTPLAVLAGISALALAWKWRSIRPLLVFVAMYYAVGSVIFRLKNWSDRVPPLFGPGPDGYGPPYPDAAHATFFTGGESFPSGHAVNTVVSYAMLLAFLTPLVAGLSRRWLRVLIRVGPPVLVAWSMTYLSFHWFSEAVAGITLGVIIERIVLMVPWERIWLPGFLRRLEDRREP